MAFDGAELMAATEAYSELFHGLSQEKAQHVLASAQPLVSLARQCFRWAATLEEADLIEVKDLRSSMIRHVRIPPSVSDISRFGWQPFRPKDLGRGESLLSYLLPKPRPRL